MGRRKNDPRPLGRQGAFTGVKLAFLESYKDQWLAVSKDRGNLYTIITKAFLARFGYELAIEEDPKDGDSAPTSLEIDPSLSPEEQAKEVLHREEVYNTLRTKLACWYRHRYTAKNTNQAYINKIIDQISSVSVSRPRKKTPLNIYSKSQWKDKLKLQFDTVWNSVKETMQPEDRMKMYNEFIKASWEKEGEETRKEILKQTEEENESAIAEWKSKAIFSGTAEGYDEAWKTAESVLPTFADAMSEWLGATVMIFAVSPLGSEGGEIAMQSAQSDTSKGATKRIIPEYDPEGFSKIQDIMLKYGRAYFSPEECLRRVLKSDQLLEIDPPESDTESKFTGHANDSDKSVLGPDTQVTVPEPSTGIVVTSSVSTQATVPEPSTGIIASTRSVSPPQVTIPEPSTGLVTSVIISPQVTVPEPSTSIAVTSTVSTTVPEPFIGIPIGTISPPQVTVPSTGIAAPVGISCSQVAVDAPADSLDFDFSGIDWSKIQPLSPKSLKQINESNYDTSWYSQLLSEPLQQQLSPSTTTLPALTPALLVPGAVVTSVTTTPLSYQTPAPFSTPLSPIQPIAEPKASDTDDVRVGSVMGNVVGSLGEKGVILLPGQENLIPEQKKKRDANSIAIEGEDTLGDNMPDPKRMKTARPERTRNLPERFKDGGYAPPKKSSRAAKS